MLDGSDRFHVPDGFDEGDVGPSEYSLQTYMHPGPVAEKFFLDRSFISFIQGPYGSAKTTTCFFKLLERAMRMPICLDGKRRYRALVLRDTYRRMERTAIRSWNKWFPKTVGHWEGGQDRPSKHVLEFEDLDGVPLVFEIEFAAVGDLDVEDFMGGYEITDLYLNEVNLQTLDVLTYGAGRCGRFPSMKDLPRGSSFDYGVIGDLNAPEPDSWIMALQFGDFDPESSVLGRSAFFLQPGGRERGAENTHNLPPDYYARLAAANKHQPWWVARMIDNKQGYSRHGKPVYEVYSDDRHCAPAPLKVDRSLPLLFGFDAGLHPSCVVGQQQPDGRIRIVKEFLPGWMGPARFAELVQAWLMTEARDVTLGMGWADPTAFDGADREGGELSWVQTVQKVLGIRIDPAPSNEPSIRIDAVAQMLTHAPDGTTPALIICPSCRQLRKGYVSGYRFNKVKTDLGDGYAYKPAKNDYSHVHDAQQYLVLGLRGKHAVIDRRFAVTARQAPTAGAKPSTDFSVFGARRDRSNPGHPR